MKKNFHFLVLFALFVLASCSSDKNKSGSTVPITKTSANDPFKNTMPESQFFEIESGKENVVESKNGTVMVLPQGCFKSPEGEIVKGKVKIELAEGLAMDDMLLANLTTTSNGEMLETGGMLFFSATADGKQLSINKENPPYAELPTPERKPGMKIWKGSRDDKGNMNWTEPRELEKFLVAVNQQLLNFLPKGFEAEVQKGMPFRKHAVADEKLIDSLYYSLSKSDGGDLIKGFVPTDYNEAYYNQQKKMTNKKYMPESFEVRQGVDHGPSLDTGAIHPSNHPCRIDPALIQTAKSKEFKNSLLATREFEQRFRFISDNACGPQKTELLMLYVKNLGLDLWKIDEMAAKVAGSGQLAEQFKNFAAQKLTSVKAGKKTGEALSRYYDEKLAKINQRLESLKKEEVAVLNKQNKIAEEKAQEYKDLLWEREKYRMPKYGFTLQDTGWLNVDVPGPFPKTSQWHKLNYTIDNATEFDRVLGYVIYTPLASLYRLNTTDNVHHFVGNEERKEMIMPKNAPAVAICIGYKGDSPSVAIREFVTVQDDEIKFHLEASTPAELRKLLMKYDSKMVRENRIRLDMEYMDFFFKEKQRQKKLQAEFLFIADLHHFTCKCCEEGYASDSSVKEFGRDQ